MTSFEKRFKKAKVSDDYKTIAAAFWKAALETVRDQDYNEDTLIEFITNELEDLK
ncbi:MAG: hypothetical protein IMZ47_04235 [Firmicutes bacterium]|nr:hypothetical protein [Bacillota bacterium]